MDLEGVTSSVVSSGGAVRQEPASGDSLSITQSLEIEEHKRLFYLNAHKHFENSSKLFPHSKFLEIVESIKTFDSKPHSSRTCLDYRWQKSYILLVVPVGEGEEATLVRRKDHSEGIQYKDIKRLAYIEEVFDIIRKIHVEEAGHPGPRVTHEIVGRKYSNISRMLCDIFCKLCTCFTQKKLCAKPQDIKPIITFTYNERSQVDLIDMQALPYDGYRWILNYQDHLTKLCVLRALKSKEASAVAQSLYEIFSFLGTPNILQSDNGREFVNKVVQELKEIWPELILVNGRPRHPQSQGSVERANQDVKKLLYNWMRDNNSQNWPYRGIHDVQRQKNSRYHSGIRAVPYTLVFGQSPRRGLGDLPIPRNVLEKINTEEELEELIANIPMVTVIDEHESEESTADCVEVVLNEHGDTPRRGEKRSAASAALRAQAERMKRFSTSNSPDDERETLEVGSVVLVKPHEVDRGQIDSIRFPAVVVEVTPNELFRLYAPGGVLQSCYNRYDLIHEPYKTPVSYQRHLGDYMNWKNAPTISEREAARVYSPSHGHGFTKCSCKGKCDSQKCVCKKKGVLCNSSCHRNNLLCLNK